MGGEDEESAAPAAGRTAAAGLASVTASDTVAGGANWIAAAGVADESADSI